MVTSRLEHYENQYRELRSQLSDIGFISPGTLVLRETSCGNPRCRCMGDPPRFHGPYYQWSTKVNNKTVSRRLSVAEAELFQEWIANRGELQRIIAEMQEVSAKAGELLLGQIEKAGKC